MKKYLLRGLVSLIPIFLILINVTEYFEINNPKNDYPFGSDFFSTLSIYSSKLIYIGYLTLFNISLLAMIVSIFWGNKKILYSTLVINIILLLYPMLTN